MNTRINSTANQSLQLSLDPNNTLDPILEKNKQYLSTLASSISQQLDFSKFKPAQITGLKEFVNAPLQNAGLYDSPQEGYKQHGVSKNGSPFFVNPELATKPGFTDIAKEQMVSTGTVLDSIGAFSSEDDARAFDNAMRAISNKDVLGNITTALSSGDRVGATKNVLNMLSIKGDEKQNLPAYLAATNVLDNWDNLNDTQQSLALAGLATTAFKFSDGKPLTGKVLATTKEGKPLTTGAALSFLQNGVNVPQVLENWDTIDALQRMTFGPGSPSQMVSTAKRMGMLSPLQDDPVNESVLGAAGFKAAPSAGVGGIVGPANKLPQGYSAIRNNPDGTVFAVPAGMEDTAAEVNGGLASAALGVAASGLQQTSLSANKIASNWLPGAPIDRVKGTGSSAQVLATLNRVTKDDPYMLGAIVANSSFGNVFTKDEPPVTGRSTPARVDLGSIGANAQPNFNLQERREDPKVRNFLQAGQATTTFVAGVSRAMQAGELAKGSAEATGYLNAVAAGERLYSVLNNPNATDKEKAEAVAGATQSGTQLAASAGMQAAKDALPYIGIAMTAYNASKVLSSNASEEDKARALTNAAEDSAASYFSMGLSSVAQYLDRQFLGGQTDKLRNKVKDNELLFAALSPTMFGAEKAMSAGMKLMGGKSQDQMARDKVRGAFKQIGLVDDQFQITLADGKKADLGTDGKGGKHEFRFPDKVPAGAEKRSLNAYDVDYTNDLDYAASMGAGALTRLLMGGKGTSIDQVGGQLANAVISSVGFGQDMTEENFDTVMTNMRAVYAQSGVKSKEDMYALANEAFSQGRLSEFDYIQAKQSAEMIFGEAGFDTAATLMEGRWKGLETAAQTGKAPGPNLVFKLPEAMGVGGTQEVVDAVMNRADEIQAEWDAGNYWGVQNSGAIPKLYKSAAADTTVTRRTNSMSTKDMTREEIAKMNRARGING